MALGGSFLDAKASRIIGKNCASIENLCHAMRLLKLDRLPGISCDHNSSDDLDSNLAAILSSIAGALLPDAEDSEDDAELAATLQALVDFICIIAFGQFSLSATRNGVTEETSRTEQSPVENSADGDDGANQDAPPDGDPAVVIPSPNFNQKSH